MIKELRGLDPSSLARSDKKRIATILYQGPHVNRMVLVLSVMLGMVHFYLSQAMERIHVKGFSWVTKQYDIVLGPLHQVSDSIGITNIYFGSQDLLSS